MVDPIAELRSEFDTKLNELGLAERNIASGVISDSSLEKLRLALPATHVERTEFQYRP
jgi:hypothetical protein